MDTSLILSYLSDLEKNNNREWYHAHKAEYQKAAGAFESLVGELILKIGTYDPSILHNTPKDLTFKLVRDTRFSHDKSPYNPSFRAHIGVCGKLPIPVGYYLMVRPGNRSFLGGGLFTDVFREATAMVRDFLVKNPDEWESILLSPSFAKRFQVKGEALKNVPAGYDKTHPQAEFLKYKSWYVEYPVEDERLRDADAFLSLAAEIFQAMKPFNDYLNRALVDFKMPAR